MRAFFFLYIRWNVCTSFGEFYVMRLFKAELDTLRDQNARLREDCKALRTRLVEIEQQQVHLAS